MCYICIVLQISSFCPTQLWVGRTIMQTQEEPFILKITISLHFKLPHIWIQLPVLNLLDGIQLVFNSNSADTAGRFYMVDKYKLGENNHPNCGKWNMALSVYPGETFQVTVVSTGQRNGIHPAKVREVIGVAYEVPICPANNFNVYIPTAECDPRVVCTCMAHVQLLGINTVLHIDCSDLPTRIQY